MEMNNKLTIMVRQKKLEETRASQIVVVFITISFIKARSVGHKKRVSVLNEKLITDLCHPCIAFVYHILSRLGLLSSVFSAYY